MASELVWVAYPVASVVVVLFGLFALTVAILHLRRSGKDSQEFFLTARNSAGIFRVSWSFFAGVMGSWALFSAPSYAYASGASLLAPLSPRSQTLIVSGSKISAAPCAVCLPHTYTLFLSICIRICTSSKSHPSYAAFLLQTPAERFKHILIGCLPWPSTFWKAAYDGQTSQQIH